MASTAKLKLLRRAAALVAASCLLLVAATSASAESAPGTESVEESAVIADVTTVSTAQIVSIVESVGIGDGTTSVAGQHVALGEVVAVGDGHDTHTGETVAIGEGIVIADGTESQGTNTPPAVLLSPFTGDEGSAAEGAGSFTDADSLTWTATVEYGDGTPAQPLTLQPDKTIELSHVYDDDGAYLVTVTVTDGQGATGTATAAVTIENVAPEATLADAAGDEGNPVTIALTEQSDPSAADTAAGFTYRFACDGTTLGAETSSSTTQCTFDDDGTYSVLARIADKDGGQTDYTADVVVENAPPDGTLGNDGPVTEGGSATISWSDQSDPSAADTAAGFTYSYACDGVTLGAPTSEPTTTCSFDDDGTYPVLARITDKDGGFTDRTTTVEVTNLPPTATLGNDGPVAEGSSATIAFADQADPSQTDTAAGFTYRYACDGVTLGPPTADPATTCAFDDGPAMYTVLARIIDEDGGEADYTTDVAVTNVAPTGTLVTPAQTTDEGSSFTLEVTDASDPSAADTAAGFTIEFDCGTGAGFASSATCTAIDDPSQAVRARIADKDGGETILTADVAVANVAPAVTITGPPSGSLYRIGDPVTFTGTFTDAGIADTHTALWSFDSTNRPGTVTEAGGFGSVSLVTSFAEAGVYSVTLTVTDDGGGAGSATTVDGLPAIVVVYDPSAGFVTGGGWILSPPGAYPADPTATGPATFGFVARYKPGASKPTGNTEFLFDAAGFDFRSTSYDWLVIAGSKAQYRGEGSVNGLPGFGFMLTAYDGSPDRLRLKVWDASDNVVYDNRSSAPDDIDAADPQAIGGGSIVIQRR